MNHKIDMSLKKIYFTVKDGLAGKMEERIPLSLKTHSILSKFIYQRQMVTDKMGAREE
ncbi:hypothetical protein I79_025762 [Cricetulus griseus]|uniref:Uncharacterized protein n=1 Tax=Cricetulus griseus TaxID=10029 RepID=G3IP59_CRIGR|nr:hypothetical protein I79_025762 [Cricetulus griseus]